MIVSNRSAANPLLALPFQPAFEGLGEDYADPVVAAEFPSHILRFRNDALLPLLGQEPTQVSDDDFVEAFGEFRSRQPLLAMRYHGYQFGDYNPRLGDGRGFLYGQVRGSDGDLYDLGTKGSGTTPYSRGGDGRLTLKGGVREVLAAEALHHLGVRTSRCLSLVETGEPLWRGDEPSPTRSSVMVRLAQTHIRFGTFERLHYVGRQDLIQKLLDHVIEIYYPHLLGAADRYLRFYTELVQRVAELTAQWMSVGFCHAVLNTDNMSIAGESFDYGPYAFITHYDPQFTAAYFDYFGRYCYGNQPTACAWNLQMLQVPLKGLIEPFEMETALAGFEPQYLAVYRQRMLRKLGFEIALDGVSIEVADELLRRSLQMLWNTKVGYHDFFLALRQQFSAEWRQSAETIFQGSIDPAVNSEDAANSFEQWRQFYHQVLNSLPAEELPAIAQRLRQHNPTKALIRPEIEAVWEAITNEDNWQPFNELVKQLQTAVEPSLGK
ncbi:YdiU family protein [Phormidium tenue FACHB-886]|nr:YdiU family protein [Phormidium tenue FACHB-886]